MVHWTGVFQEGVHGCSENAHFLDPGSWDGGWGLALMIPSVWMIGILPLLLGVGLYLWCAGAFTFIGKGTPAPIDARAESLGRSGMLSVGSQSDVRRRPFGGDR